jgi:hypothetical protein
MLLTCPYVSRVIVGAWPICAAISMIERPSCDQQRTDDDDLARQAYEQRREVTPRSQLNAT